MASKSKIKEYYLANASNFIYSLISDADIQSVFNDKKSAVIRRKREYQIAYIINSAQSSGYTYNDILGIINDGILKEYGKSGKDVLFDLCNGKNVLSKTTIQKSISADLATDIINARVDAGIVDDRLQLSDNVMQLVKKPSVGAKINSKTGLPAGSSWDSNKNVEVSTDGKYFINYDCETDTPIGVWEYDTGKQISYYDTKKGKYVAGSTPSSDANSRNLWCNNIDWSSIIMAIINLIGQLFSGLKKASQMAALQSDGWYGAAYNTADTYKASGNTLTVALLCVGGYLLFRKKSKKSKTQKSNY